MKKEHFYLKKIHIKISKWCNLFQKVSDYVNGYFEFCSLFECEFLFVWHQNLDFSSLSGHQNKTKLNTMLMMTTVTVTAKKT